MTHNIVISEKDKSLIELIPIAFAGAHIFIQCENAIDAGAIVFLFESTKAKFWVED